MQWVNASLKATERLLWWIQTVVAQKSLLQQKSVEKEKGLENKVKQTVCSALTDTTYQHGVIQQDLLQETTHGQKHNSYYTLIIDCQPNDTFSWHKMLIDYLNIFFHYNILYVLILI